MNPLSGFSHTYQDLDCCLLELLAHLNNDFDLNHVQALSIFGDVMIETLILEITYKINKR
jgi:hypothetical protein